MTDEEVLAQGQHWFEKAVIGLNLCPFAKAVHVKNQVRWVVSHARHIDDWLDELERELALLVATPAEDIDTTLLIHPHLLPDFLDFNDFLDLAEGVLHEQGLEGVLQLASFHPGFQFADTAPDDISNYSNRAPFPILHLLREDSVDKAVASFPEAEAIFAQNIQTLEKLGHAGWQALAYPQSTAGLLRNQAAMPSEPFTPIIQSERASLEKLIKTLDTAGSTKPSNAIEIINPFLADENIRVRVAAAFNLGRLADNNVIPHLINKALGNDDDDVRAEALAALENYKSPEILDCLATEVYREKLSRRPRQEVAKQLRYYDAEKAVDVLIILLDDEDVFVRDDTAESLLQLNRPRLVDVWKKALRDASDDVRNIAITALTNLGCVEEAIDELVALLQDDDFFMRCFIAECLLKLNRPRLHEVWEKALNDQRKDIRDIAAQAIQELADERSNIQ